MTTPNQKQEIVQSLSNLDAVQSEKVLNYIKALLHGPAAAEQQKEKAMREINSAITMARLWI